jgi:hypothetical protein
MSQKIEPRWLDPEHAADYIGVRMPQLNKMAKDGLVKPNYMLGPRRPRYDRLELDAMFNKNNGTSIDAAIEEAFDDESRASVLSHRSSQARGRNL